MPDIHGVVNWFDSFGNPSIVGVRSAFYTIGQGISPGSINLTCVPQANPPATYGYVQLTDSVNGILTIPRCRLEDFNPSSPGPGGIQWTLTIKDRRWMWKDLGIIFGVYNVPDQTGDITRPPPDAAPVLRQTMQYIPWTIKRVVDLMTLCLQAMGETGFQISLPPGTDTKESLPPMAWPQGVNPAFALQQLADQVGCRVVYRLDTDTVLVAPLGVGGPLPDGPMVRDCPPLTIPARPDRITVIGDATRVQMRLLLEPVGEEWDGSLQPVNNLTYRPDLIPRPQVGRITVLKCKNGSSVRIFFFSGAGIVPIGTANAASTSTNTTTFATTITAAINAAVGKVPITAAAVVNKVTLTGDVGKAWRADVQVAGGAVVAYDVVQKVWDKNNPWGACQPPDFVAVKEVPGKLTYKEAQDKARKSVYLWYRVMNVNPATGVRPLVVPKYGPITRLQQLILGDTQLEQTVPTAAQDLIANQGDGFPYSQFFYNGLFREKPAQAFGLHCRLVSGIHGTRLVQQNTEIFDPLYITLSIDPARWLVQFSDYVFRLDNGTCSPCRGILLQTSLSVRDKDTNAPAHWTSDFDFPEKFGTPTAYIHREGIDYLIVADYTNNANPGQITNVIDNRTDTLARSNYYLNNEAFKFELKGKLDREYPGILPIYLDGAIAQVTWSVGEGGCKTHASLNSEHAYWIPKAKDKFYLNYISPAHIDETQQHMLRPGDLARPPAELQGRARR